MLHKAYKAQFKAVDEGAGIFEALVAVFNNVDRGGDRILPGAFTATLDDWAQKGRPIPVIYSHEWDNLDAHIGQVLDAKETEEGLWVQGQLEMDEPFAQRVYKKMKNGTLAEFSFAYDVVEAKEVGDDDRAAPNHYQDLVQLDLLEVGPCLVGMNPETQLLDVKSGARHSAKDVEMVQKIHDLAVSLGAKCAEVDDSGDGGSDSDEGKARNGKSSVDSRDRQSAKLSAYNIGWGISAKEV